MSDRPWLVTGAAGFLGSHVVEDLLARGERVLALDNLQWGDVGFLEPSLANPNCSLLVADIRDAEGMRKLFARFRPANVVHLAALHYIPACVADPPLATAINVVGTQTVLSASIPSGLERFWFASTGDIYPLGDAPHREEERPSPFNIYGQTKWMGEQLVALAARDHPTKCFAVGRLLNLYGPRETNPHFLPELIKQIRDRPDAPLRLGNLWPKRDLVPVDEAACAVVEMTMAVPAGLTTANVATGTARSMQEVIDMIEEILGRRLPVEIDPAKVRPVERPHLQADVARLAALIGWTPRSDLRRGLERLLRGEGVIS
ncbi:MAG: NAD(P)-dependent oxidoreductase [Isosphaeraceae bacterium]|nr:NAD(P)-dependent oxidoreductase [Isosphaeraceae bacterium]